MVNPKKIGPRNFLRETLKLAMVTTPLVVNSAMIKKKLLIDSPFP